jgi:o-succinylbenzoate---CoA ligase|tara:strand:+ start:1594 stop:2589 length:996 start_codon:yes stop_codon:yes gene_type:complete
LTHFIATYADDFIEKAFVEAIVKKWAKNTLSFALHSSGSTGDPKEIKLDRSLLQWSAMGTKSALNLGDNISILCCLPIEKTGGFMQLIRALVWNCPIHFVTPTNDPSLHLNSSHYSLTSLTPTQLENILAQDFTPSSSITILVGGAPISPRLEEKLSTTGLRFIETYGMTETASHIALREVGKDSLFKAQDGVVLSVIEDCLSISIPELGLNVLTHDIVELSDQRFKLLGRSDDVINSGGVKIHPVLIEPLIAVSLASAGINRTFYLSKKPNTVFGEIAVLVLEGEAIQDSSYLIELLKRDIPAYQHPKELVFVDQIQFTNTGKVIRKSIT